MNKDVRTSLQCGCLHDGMLITAAQAAVMVPIFDFGRQPSIASKHWRYYYTHHTPIKLSISLITVKCIVDAWDPASQYQAENAEEVEEKVSIVDLVRVVCEQMEAH